MKTEHVTKGRVRHCGDVDLTDYLSNAAGPVSLVLDLHIDIKVSSQGQYYFRNGSGPNDIELHYPNDIDKSLNEAATDKIRKYRTDYNNRDSSGN